MQWKNKSRTYSDINAGSVQREKAVRILFMLCAAAAAAMAAVIWIFLLANGIPALLKIGVKEFLLGMEWRPSGEIYGIFPMIVGSALVTAGAVAVGVPSGVMTAVFMARFCSPQLCRIMRRLAGIMAGIPSVVYGFFGLSVIVPLIRECFGGRGMSLLAASLLLGIMIMPTVIAAAESALGAAPQSVYEGSLALGASHEYSVFHAVLPAAKNGIMAAVILAVGRAAGETMAVMMVAGNQPIIPEKLTDGVRTLTANIALEMGYAADLHRDALTAAAMVLFVMNLIINSLFVKISKGDA